MKHALPFAFVCVMVSMGSCKKNPTTAVSPAGYTLDTALFEYKANGIQYKQTYIISSNPDSFYNYEQGSIAGAQDARQFSGIPEYNFSLYIQGSNLSIDILINGDTSATLALPGVFVYNPAHIDSTNYFAAAFNWGQVEELPSFYGYPISDTVTITAINYQMASGTFSATFENQILYPGQDTLLHITDGVFKNLPVN